MQIDDNELIKSYKTRWLDRDYGRQKIITAYVRFCQKPDFLASLNLPHNFTHVVIGGNCGIYAVYTIDFFGTLSVTIQDYSCFHAETDTVVFYALNHFLKNNTDAQGSSIIMHCPEADNVTILLLEHSLIQDLLRNHSVRLFCSIHRKLVDIKTKKPTRKVKEAASVLDFKESSSKMKINFYIDVQMLYDKIIESESFSSTVGAIESLGVLFTGNDKNPGVRHVTKTLALHVYKEACEKGIISSLIDHETYQLVDNIYCKKSFFLLYARIYFVMYRVLIRKLPDITWDVLVTSGKPNLKLLRDIGCQYSKGQLDKVLPVEGVLNAICLRSVFQANEYHQIFERNITYLDPINHGFEKFKGGLRPLLNLASDSDSSSQIVISSIHETLLNSINDTSESNTHAMCPCNEASEDLEMDDLSDNPEYQALISSFFASLGNQVAQNVSQGNILETTIENIEDDEDLHNNDLDSDYDCFGFDQW